MAWRQLKLYSSLAFGVVAFVVAMIALNHLIGPTRCGDGWPSPSIGRRGACSWHGGVNWSPAELAFLASVIIGIGVGLVGERLKRRRTSSGLMRPASRPLPSLLPPQRGATPRINLTPGVRCPRCDSVMKKRLARRGRNAGREFWGCSRFPTCTGTRAM